MKTIIFIIGFSAGLMGQALAQTDQPASSSGGDKRNFIRRVDNEIGDGLS